MREAAERATSEVTLAWSLRKMAFGLHRGGFRVYYAYNTEFGTNRYVI